MIFWNPMLLALPMLASGFWVGPYLEATMEESHERAVHTFLNRKGFGGARIGRRGLWNDKSVYFENKLYRFGEIHLLGLTEEYGDRYFTRIRPPRKGTDQELETRSLTVTEKEFVERLRSNPESMVLSGPGTDSNYWESIRVMAAIPMRAECLDCHAGDIGDVIGAFEYELRGK